VAIGLAASYIEEWLIILIFAWGIFLERITIRMKCPMCGAQIGYRDAGLGTHFRLRWPIAPRNCERCGYDLSKPGQAQTTRSVPIAPK
jgi:hypothetical protein